MTNLHLQPLLTGAILLAATGASAQEFTWEAEIEIGVESVLDSNVSGNEVDDPFFVGELHAELAFGAVSFFSHITAEEMTGPSAGISDLGIYLEELGVRYDADSFSIALGKAAPAFGTAFEDAAGYFGVIMSEDYELVEQIGLFADVEVIEGGTLSFGAFYADDTRLSRSFGFNRGENSTLAGGAGNTGSLDNFAAQWRQEFGNTFYIVGARHLSKGTGDVSDETGFVAGIGHSFEASLPVDVFAEIASFDGFGGTNDDALYGTLTAAISSGNTSYSAAYNYRDIDSVGDTNQFTIGIDHEFANGSTLGGAIGWQDDAGADEAIFGASLIIPFGG